MGQVLPADRWLRLRPLLDRALDLDAGARHGLLESLAADSPTLKADLERLLKLHGGDEAELDRPAAQLVAPTMLLPSEQTSATAGEASGPYCGTVVGPFRLERLIGSGGMGAVYLARRISGGFEQTVAVKLITGLHPGLKQRFQRERQILADLRHPNIAQLLDGGETAVGLPYLVMEFVEGHTLVDYCEQTSAALDERLRLLIEVAQALHHAHQRKLIHRDIKPGNILVSRSGEVKLLDFGIAKLLDESESSALTLQTVGPMTPAYAAPEQFSGAPLGAATDLYQWGVLAFRVLSGRSPYRYDSSNPAVLARLISDSSPLSLQSVLSSSETPRARPGSSDPRPVESGLQRVSGTTEPSPPPPADLLANGRACADLNLILRRCLKKDPGQRYADMQALIADVQAVRQRHAPRVRVQRLRLLWLGLGAALLLLLAVVLTARMWPTADTAGNEWHEDMALNSMGLDSNHLYLADQANELLIKQALRLEAQGDLASALALLESVHNADASTPIPAMLLSYWSATPEARSSWRALAEQRQAGIKDVKLELLHRFMQADAGSNIEETLRYSAALLELAPRAWYLRMARAHRYSQRDLRGAGLAELQRIDVSRLGHRRLVDSIADRASFGDLPGALAVVERLAGSTDDPELVRLRARLAFSAGDLQQSLALFQQSVQLARLHGRTDIESRGLLYSGVLQAALGDYPRAAEQVRAARAVFEDRGQLRFAIDCSLVLAQLAALMDMPDEVATELERARALHAEGSEAHGMELGIELIGARLSARVPQVPARATLAERALLDARAAVLDSDSAAALAALERARRERIELTPWAEEYRLLRQELDLPLGDLPPLDPPFQPYFRFVARSAMGQSTSIAPKVQAQP